jgi:hypothetical protein
MIAGIQSVPPPNFLARHSQGLIRDHVYFDHDEAASGIYCSVCTDHPSVKGGNSFALRKICRTMQRDFAPSPISGMTGTKEPFVSPRSHVSMNSAHPSKKMASSCSREDRARQGWTCCSLQDANSHWRICPDSYRQVTAPKRCSGITVKISLLRG